MIYWYNYECGDWEIDWNRYIEIYKFVRDFIFVVWNLVYINKYEWKRCDCWKIDIYNVCYSYIDNKMFECRLL